MVAILMTGNWSQDQVKVNWGNDSRLRFDAVERLIDQTWTAALSRPAVKLFDGDMCRMESWHRNADSLHIVLSQTSYKTFFGTNLSHPELFDLHGPAVMANPVGLGAVVLTLDGFLVFGRRNDIVAYHSGRIHPFAGCLEPRDGVDIFRAMKRELAEELALTDGEISEIRLLGIVEDSAMHQPELIFSVKTVLFGDDIEPRVDIGEHRGFHAVAATRDGILAEMKNEALTPVAVGALQVWGRREFGNEFPRD